MSDYTPGRTGQSEGGGAKGLLLAVLAIIAIIAVLGFFGTGSAPTDDGTAAPAVEETAPAATGTEAAPATPTE
ncbi:MAG: hypothetical protein AAGK92_08210 [Pseudomonadota bacterium]